MNCPEPTAPWACPALAPWATLPHDTACGTFDGSTFPAASQGACSATAPTGSALQKTNASGSPVVLPDGRRLEPAGNEWVFDDFPGGFPSGALLLPGSPWLAVVDTGYDTHSIRIVDSSLLRAGVGGSPVASTARYDAPKALNWGVAYALHAKTLYVASGYEATDNPDSAIYAFVVDPYQGFLTADAARTIALPSGTFPQGIAVSPDEKTLLVGQVSDSKVLVVSLDPASYGKVTGRVDVGADDVFEIRFDPYDPTGNTAYATLWLGAVNNTDPSTLRLAQLDVAGGKAHIIGVGREPEGMEFLDAKTMVVAEGFADSLAIVDRPTAKVVGHVPLGNTGAEPTSLVYDPPRSRLYATLASENAIQVFDVDTTATPPAIAPAGRIPTGWWPTAISVLPSDGTLFVVTGRGHGLQGVPNGADGASLMRGSVQAVPFLDGAALAAATAKSDGDNEVQAYDGYPTVQCGGAPYDFPVPETPASGPSKAIQHVVFIERENKTFDALFGDLPGVDGEPSYILSPQHQGSIWQNARSWANGFAHMDNYYAPAEQSIQGHYWDVFGRSSDVDERRWVVIWGRGEVSSLESPGVAEVSSPLEGSVFSDLQAGGVTIENDGEDLALGYFNTSWPGGTTGGTIPDTHGACYLAARARVTCDLPQFTYVWLVNDHTFGLQAGSPNPSIMMSVNDEATGMILDGISHSPMWPSTLVVVVEDDPSTGLDHVDMHRSIALFASPWVKRGYVSHAHYDISSLHKLFADIFGKAYRNEEIANAALPLDMFTSTPDYSPFNYLPRTFSDASCNPLSGQEAIVASKWDFSHPDEQPGLGAQLREYFRSR
jgi:DNA-binding beta-propeller fold protein YncE